MPSEHCRGTFEQGSKPTNSHTGLCDDLLTHPGAEPAFARMRPLPVTSKGIKWSRRHPHEQWEMLPFSLQSTGAS